MNLSSKEIAPLMNISYRGVELHRYRLRKKLSLTADENLSTFMINL
jgi:DNA-binding CsgD family transcriptional regulator